MQWRRRAIAQQQRGAHREIAPGYLQMAELRSLIEESGTLLMRVKRREHKSGQGGKGRREERGGLPGAPRGPASSRASATRLSSLLAKPVLQAKGGLLAGCCTFPSKAPGTAP